MSPEIVAAARQVTPNQASVFRYDALRGDGSRERGTVTARERAAALRVLRDRGLHPLSVRPASEGSGGRRRLSARELAGGLRALGDLTHAGMSIAKALHVYAQVAPPAWAALIPSITSEIRQGRGFAAALATQPGAVPVSLTAMIDASERGEGLGKGLLRAADMLDESIATRRAIIGALTYPMLLAGIGTISVAFLVAVILPRLAALVSDLGQQLPASTRLLLMIGAVDGRTWIVLLLLTLASAALLAQRLHSAEGRREWHELLLRVPLVGRIRFAMATVRACATMSALMDSGVRVATALAHAADSASDRAVARRIALARSDVIAGAPTSKSLGAHDALTPTAIQLARVGEENGRLSDMLRQAARIEHERALETVRVAVRMIEPVTVLVFGGIIAFVAAAMLQAVYSIRPLT